jgi:hypothetical protein
MMYSSINQGAMTTIQIERMIEDIDTVVKYGQQSLEDKEKGYPYVAGYYESVLKTLSFMLSQELK